MKGGRYHHPAERRPKTVTVVKLHRRVRLTLPREHFGGPGLALPRQHLKNLGRHQSDSCVREGEIATGNLLLGMGSWQLSLIFRPAFSFQHCFWGFSTMMPSDVLIFRSSRSRVDPRSLASVVIHSTSSSAIQRPPLINASTPHQIHPASLGLVPRQQSDVISLGQHAKGRAARKRIPKFLVVLVPSPGSAITSRTWLKMSIDSDPP